MSSCHHLNLPHSAGPAGNVDSFVGTPASHESPLSLPSFKQAQKAVVFPSPPKRDLG
jgi:hypothetical protein